MAFSGSEAAVTATLEWPRFCYNSAAAPTLPAPSTLFNIEAKPTALLLQPTIQPKPAAPKKGRKRKATTAANVTLPKKPNTMYLNSLFQEHRVPQMSLFPQLESNSMYMRPLEDLAYSNIMKKMAEKYNKEPEEIIKQEQAAPALFPFYNPFSMLNPTPNFASELALLALQKTMNGGGSCSSEASSPPRSTTATTGAPLDLSPRSYESSSPAPGSELGSAAASESEDDMDRWGVHRVAEFVASIEGCAEYKETFLNQCIDGSSLQLLSESHLTGNSFLRMRLGPAIRLLRAIKEYNCKSSIDSGADFINVVE